LPVAVYTRRLRADRLGRPAAAALIVAAPVLLPTLLAQKEIVTGLTAKGVTGA
jgi:multiple sugar transport system permease protein